MERRKTGRQINTDALPSDVLRPERSTISRQSSRQSTSSTTSITDRAPVSAIRVVVRPGSMVPML